MFGKADAALPRLDAFDEEFGPGPATILREPRRRTRLWSWILICLVLLGAIASALALAWPIADGWQGTAIRSASVSPQTTGREGADDQVTRLMREVAVLKHELRELTAAQQQAADTIAALQGAAQDAQARLPSAYWYSDLAGLIFGFASPGEAGIVEPTYRRPAAVRARSGDTRRGAPMSLDPPQN